MTVTDMAKPGTLLWHYKDYYNLVSRYPRLARNRIEEAFAEADRAFVDKLPRKTGEPAVAHSHRTGFRVCRIMVEAGYFGSEPVELGELHDVPEDTEAATPYKNPLHGYLRMPDRYGHVLTRALLLVSRGRRSQQSEEEHLEQLLKGEDRFYHNLKRMRAEDTPQTIEDRLIKLASRSIRGTASVIRWTLRRPNPKRYPLPTGEWILFIARLGKVCDRLDNMESYCDPTVYGNRLGQLQHKLELTIKYYVPIAAKVLEAAPPQFVGPVQRMCAELDWRIRQCQEYLALQGR